MAAALSRGKAVLLAGGIFGVIWLFGGRGAFFGQPSPAALPASALVHAAPQGRFRDNLRSDSRYITTWPSSGYTNDLVSLMNLVYLALQTDRIPVLPQFAPTHVGEGAGLLPVSRVFDVPRLAREIGRPVVEWQDVKDLRGPVAALEDEDLSCWSLHMHLFGKEERAPSEALMGLDVAYWPIRQNMRVGHTTSEMKMANLMALAALDYSQFRNNTMSWRDREPVPAPHSLRTPPPDEHLLCFDYLFFAGTYSQEHLELYDEHWPVWRAVGRHLHFAPDFRELARGMVHRALGIAADAITPPFIAVHVRHGDFADWCPGGMSRADCFAPLADYARAADAVRHELAQQNVHVAPNHILLGSDEPDPAFWEDAAGRGWAVLDHAREDTVARYGAWYPSLLETAAQSLATGFVGTDRSTFSLISRRRVQSWHDASAYRDVHWGQPHANGV